MATVERTPIERRDFDEDATRERAAKAAFVDVESGIVWNPFSTSGESWASPWWEK